MVNMKEIYVAQTNFVYEIAKDILKHDASADVCKHADEFATIDSPYGTSGSDSGEFIRVQFGEAYAYVNIEPVNEEASEFRPVGNIWFNNDEMGCNGTTYDEIIKELNEANNDKLYEVGFDTWCYDKYEGKEEDYVKKLAYVPFGC